MHKKEAGGASATRLDKIFQIGNNFIVFVNDSSQPWKIMLLGYFSLLCHDQKLVTLVGANENFRSSETDAAADDARSLSTFLFLSSA